MSSIFTKKCFIVDVRLVSKYGSYVRVFGLNCCYVFSWNISLVVLLNSLFLTSVYLDACLIETGSFNLANVDLFKVNNSNIRKVVLMSLLLTLKIIYTFFWCFCCWLWTCKNVCWERHYGMKNSHFQNIFGVPHIFIMPINPLQPGVAYLYPLKTWENLKYR